MYNKTSANKASRQSRNNRTAGKKSSKGFQSGPLSKRSNSKNSHKRPSGGQRKGGRIMPTFDPTQFINKNPVQVEEIAYVPTHTFSDFELHPTILATLEKKGLITPSPIQDQIIPHILADRDVIGLAETGTGKTAAFLLPLIEKTVLNNRRQSLVMAPTRELAIQILDELRKLSWGFKFRSTVCVGGMAITPQIRSLSRKNQFIIGTPGRVMDLIKRGDIEPADIDTVVLDEADRMLDMGFISDMRSIIFATPHDRETLFFSATMDKRVQSIVGEFLTDPITVSVKKTDVTNSIAQDVVKVTDQNRFEKLTEILATDEAQRVIVFMAMKHAAERLAKDLKAVGIQAESIHGNKTHGQRQRSLESFKSGKASVLVATDVAARGIHVNDVTHVINYDLPGSFEDYVHRIGRTGRGEKKGIALTFVR